MYAMAVLRITIVDTRNLYIVFPIKSHVVGVDESFTVSAEDEVFQLQCDAKACTCVIVIFLVRVIFAKKISTPSKTNHDTVHA